MSPGCEEQQEHQQQPLQVEDGVAVAALQHPDQPIPSSIDSLTRIKIVSKVYHVKSVSTSECALLFFTLFFTI